MRRIVLASMGVAFAAVVMIGLVSPPMTVAQSAAAMQGGYDAPRTVRARSQQGPATNIADVPRLLGE